MRGVEQRRVDVVRKRGRSRPPASWPAAVTAAVVSTAAVLGGAYEVVRSTPAVAAPTAVTCGNSTPPSAQVVTSVPWPQLRFGVDRLTGIADGAGIVVAVIDSGVDPRHSQLVGAVAPGFDALGDGTGGQLDCVGHGTAVASLIAARPIGGVRFQGLAPKARIMPIRVSEQQELDGRAVGRAGSFRELAIGIRAAVDRGARVLNLSLTSQRDDPQVREAVAYAVAKGVVVVAAVGNHFDQDPPSYPAMYPHVIGVGAVGADGNRVATSQAGEYVDVTAPGTGILAAAVGRGHREYQGTSFAAPFVAATAALILQHQPGLTPDQVAARLIATADPAPSGPSSGGRPSREYGAGIVNPYRAVTERLGGPPRRLQPLAMTQPDPAAQAEVERATAARHRALAITGAGVALAALVVLGAAVLPPGIRRRWRPGLRTPISTGPPPGPDPWPSG